MTAYAIGKRSGGEEDQPVQEPEEEKMKTTDITNYKRNSSEGRKNGFYDSRNGGLGGIVPNVRRRVCVGGINNSKPLA